MMQFTIHNFFENHLLILLENVELHIRGQMWFQQDGVLAHSTKAIQNLLNEKYTASIDRFVASTSITQRP